MTTEGARAPKRAAIAFILGTIVLDVMAFGLVAPVLPLGLPSSWPCRAPLPPVLRCVFP